MHILVRWFRWTYYVCSIFSALQTSVSVLTLSGMFPVGGLNCGAVCSGPGSPLQPFSAEHVYGYGDFSWRTYLHYTPAVSPEDSFSSRFHQMLMGIGPSSEKSCWKVFHHLLLPFSLSVSCLNILFQFLSFLFS